MKVLIFLLLVCPVFADVLVVLERPNYLLKDPTGGYTTYAPSQGTVVSRLPFGYRVATVDGTRYYTYGGVFYVPDWLFASRVYRVVDSPFTSDKSWKSKLDNPRSVRINGQDYYIEIGDGEEAKYYVEDRGQYLCVSPPPGAIVEMLPIGSRAIYGDDGLSYFFGGVSYLRAKINGRRIFLAID